ncbi:Ldh family oxidoreductase [Prosthecomicrobium sp. N25]|uniref:Ldh family oxidoreductase n=1 Tax=Prosthecomicrobium sp. N25 TaxID=3129254 RepID=UPI00307787C3
MTDRILTLAEARDLVAAALQRNRTAEANARSTAAALVAAEADGHAGHGLSRVASYAAQARAGKVDGFASPTVVRTAPAVIRVDAAHGFAYPAIDRALAELPGIAASQGLAAAAIHRSHHCGAAGTVVERLAEQGLAALLFANTPHAIAPWGGRRGLFGTNPIAFACPLPGDAPLVIDLSLSKVARGRIMAAKRKGEPIPEGWALDADGRPTTDPDAALAGTMVPMGDQKGTALALMVELLAAGLTGATFAAEATSFLDAEGGPPGTGQLILVLSPEALGGPEAVVRMGRLAAAVAGEPGARLPGRRRLTLRRRAEQEGLSLSAATLADIERL